MERGRATWTDERLDDLSRRVEGGFAQIDRRIDSVESRLGARIDRLQASIDALQRMMIQFAGGMALAIIATLISVIATRDAPPSDAKPPHTVGLSSFGGT